MNEEQNHSEILSAPERVTLWISVGAALAIGTTSAISAYVQAGWPYSVVLAVVERVGQ